MSCHMKDKPLAKLSRSNYSIFRKLLFGGNVAQESKRMSAGVVALILSIFGLGWVGAHKFMLGYTNAGLIYIAVSIFTCGAAAVIFNLIALIEGIIYLTKTDEEFIRTYQIEQKEWF